MPFPAPIEVRTSKTHGRGLFATAPIKKGSPIWVFQGPGKILTGLTGEESKNKIFTSAQLEEFGRKDPAKIGELLWGGYLHVPSNNFIVLVDGGQFTNHSNDPNCGGDWAKTPQGEVSVAIRDIAAGEEITDDYGVFGETRAESSWLTALFKKYTPEREEFERAHVKERPKHYFTPVEASPKL